jgi:uncharacterized protein
MKLFLTIFLLIAGISLAGQSNYSAATKRMDTLHSAILNEDRYISIHLPRTALVDSFKRLPVIYVLDGDVLFPEVMNVLGRLNKETGKNLSGEVVVVGIGNIGLRYRDYSPTRVNASPLLDDLTAQTTGGGQAFISFLEKELLPHIKTTYRFSSASILLGHSMGGLAVMHILQKHSNLFDHYASIDPSMWWDNQNLLKELKTTLQSETFEKKSLFLAIANPTDKGMDLDHIQKDTSAKTALVRPSLTLLEYINASSHNKLRFSWKYYQDYQHMTVPSPAIYDALRYFLNIF